MTDSAAIPQDKMKTSVLIVYGCYLASFLLGITGIIGLIIAYLKKSEAEGSVWASHIQWQIRTFWLTFVVGIIGVVLSVIGIGMLILLADCVWFIFRSVKGLLKAMEGAPIVDAKAWF